jgi:hypothetical protein
MANGEYGVGALIRRIVQQLHQLLTRLLRYRRR